jgi:hypothetical protein
MYINASFTPLEIIYGRWTKVSTNFQSEHAKMHLASQHTTSDHASTHTSRP